MTTEPLRDETQSAARMGVDIGGTFTDVAVVDVNGRLRIGKTLTTPHREEEGVVAAISQSGTALDEIDVLVHGTTLVINALVERRGAKLALVTTLGFRDVYLMGLGNRAENFNIFYRRDEPLVPRHLVYEVDERVDASGNVVRALPTGSISELAERLRNDEVEAVAIAFLNSYAFPHHEEEMAAALAAELPGIYITTSSRVSRVWREYERFSTSVANAYVGPVIDRYFTAIEQALGDMDFRAAFVVLDSNGGALSIPAVKQFPVRLLESGPVGGVLGTRDVAQALALDHVISFDMGGTTAKSALVENGNFGSIDVSWPVGYATGYPVQAPCVDIVEVGAGGGSIAWVDESGRLRVGPRSAGADPGPACYGNGGIDLTVTDANVYCGRLQRDFFLGSIEIHPELAAAAVERVADKVNMDPLRLALGVLRLANLSMAEVVRRQSVVRGRDPQLLTMVGFGGAGPLHACDVAMEVGVPRVIIPVCPGHFSALGMLNADIRFDRADIVHESLDDFDCATVNARLREIGANLTSVVDDHVGAAGDPVFDYALALRYQGQEHTLHIPAPRFGLRIDPDDMKYFRQSFEAEHRIRYRHDHSDSVVEAVGVSVGVRRALPQVRLASVPSYGGAGQSEERLVHFTSDGGHLTAFVERGSLREGDKVQGPAVVYEEGANIVIPPGAVAVVLAGGHLDIDLVGGDKQ
ncbi:hydantoinase/oxoprolinase family protein [Amycolatopsis pithecellobii]|uniref:Hydantoinase/oxoprolinase family protein n=1 Tax=Amycolatopsis pithecellobii TaxID=664692 RepID=A0A6N7Z807_9PSEU|nr:hydantoinase/oxoprolinase family protein [Amycolatopsis pithecellobii]MTD57430.1 hydantoinase/oxoprolinase family protein [Amycolatopsis pithecellobii]